MAKTYDLTVDEINKELQQIFIVPALATFPQKTKTVYSTKRVIMPLRARL